jgi:hypothetical protein
VNWLSGSSHESSESGEQYQLQISSRRLRIPHQSCSLTSYLVLDVTISSIRTRTSVTLT